MLPGTGGTVTFKYDPFGRRIQKTFTQNSTTTVINYLYDGARLIEELDQGGNSLTHYAQGAGIDEPLGEARSGAASFYELDGLGSVTSLSGTTGTLSNTYTYDAFGILAASTGSLANPFQYTGRDFDQESGLRYYRARYYDSSTGRFLSEDPIRFLAGNDFYFYVHNNPAINLDPLGLKDYNEQETLQWLQQAYQAATAGFFQGLWNIRNNSQGGGPYDFGHDPAGIHQNDTWARCGVKLSAGDFGNYIAGFQGGAWDRKFHQAIPNTPFAANLVKLAGVYYQVTGDTDVPNDPWDKTGMPWINRGVADGYNFRSYWYTQNPVFYNNKNIGKCPCQK